MKAWENKCQKLLWHLTHKFFISIAVEKWKKECDVV